MPQTEARQLAREWARAMAPIVETNLLSGFDSAAQRRLNCTFAVSRELTKTNTACLVSCYGGEVFVFELTQRQAKSFHAINSRMECAEGGQSLQFPPNTQPYIELSDLSIDDADGLSGEQPIRGELRYRRAAGPPYPGTVCLSMEFSMAGRCRKTLFYYPPQGLLPYGELKFTFPAPGGEDGDQRSKGFVGPVAAHVRFLGTMNPQAPGSHVPLSNTAAALVELI